MLGQELPYATSLYQILTSHFGQDFGSRDATFERILNQHGPTEHHCEQLNEQNEDTSPDKHFDKLKLKGQMYLKQAMISQAWANPGKCSQTL